MILGIAISAQLILISHLLDKIGLGTYLPKEQFKEYD